LRDRQAEHSHPKKKDVRQEIGETSTARAEALVSRDEKRNRPPSPRDDRKNSERLSQANEINRGKVGERAEVKAVNHPQQLHCFGPKCPPQSQRPGRLHSTKKLTPLPRSITTPAEDDGGRSPPGTASGLLRRESQRFQPGEWTKKS